MDIFSITIFTGLLAFTLIGNWAGRRVKRLDDYFVAGRRAPTMLIVGTLVASVFSSSIFLGEAGFTYAGQWGPYLLFPGIAATGYVYGALLFGRYLRRSKAPTVADYFGQRFCDRRIQRVSGLIIIVALGIYLLIVTQGAAILLSQLTVLNYEQGLVVAWLSYTLFTMYSGSRGVILTDTLMFLLFAVASIAFGSYIVHDLGGVSAAVERMAVLESKPDIAAWHGVVGPGTDWPTALDYVIWAVTIDLAWSAVYAVSPWQASRHLMARNEHVVLRAAIYACIAVIILQYFIYGVSGLINLRNPAIDPPESVMIWAATEWVPDYLGAVLLAGILAAALSSASTFLSLIGFSASNDIVIRTKPLALGPTRAIMLAAGLVVLAASFVFPPSLFWLMVFVGTLFASSWGPVALMSVWSGRITADGALWGMVAGFLFNVVPSGLVYFGVIALPSYLEPTLLGVAASLFTIHLVSRRGVVSAGEATYRRQLHEVPPENLGRKQARTTLLAPAALVLYGCAVPFIMLTWYVVPYQAGAGELATDGSLNWASGEALIVILPVALWVPLGLLAARMIWRDYAVPADAPQASPTTDQ